MAMNGKTLLSAMNQAIIQAKEMDADNLVKATQTASQIVAKTVEAETSAEATTTLQNTFISTFYNKYKNGDKLYSKDVAPEGTEEGMIVDDANVYVTVATKQPASIDEVIVAGHAYKKMDTNDWKDPDSRYKNISIGMNAFLYLNVWKIDEEGNLMVAVPYIFAGTDYTTGVCKVMAGGLTYDVNVCEPLTEENVIALKSAEVTAKSGYPNECKVVGDKIEYTIGYASQALLLTFTAGGTDLTGDDVVFYRLDTTNFTVAINKPSTTGGKKVSYVRYSIPYADAPVSEARDVTNNIVIVDPAHGIYECEVVCHAVVVNA